MAEPIGNKIQITTNHVGKCGIIFFLLQINLNIAAIIQIPAMKTAIKILDREKLYNLVGMSKSYLIDMLPPTSELIGTCTLFSEV